MWQDGAGFWILLWKSACPSPSICVYKGMWWGLCFDREEEVERGDRVVTMQSFPRGPVGAPLEITVKGQKMKQSQRYFLWLFLGEGFSVLNECITKNKINECMAHTAKHPKILPPHPSPQGLRYSRLSDPCSALLPPPPNFLLTLPHSSSLPSPRICPLCSWQHLFDVSHVL